jgi:NDP-sugar pyrophosphorylase family protein
MKALVFAAGLGTRLKPLTDSIPKALVSVGGIPMLQRVILKLKASGFTRIVVNTHHFADKVAAFLGQNGNFGVDITISHEDGPEPFETGGGIKFARRCLEDGPFLVHNVDILSDLDIPSFLLACRPEALANLAVTQTEADRCFLFGEDMRLLGWTNVRTGEVRSAVAGFDPSRCRRLAFSGIHQISPAIFPLLEDWPEKFSITDFYIQAAASHPIYGVEVPGLKILDIGSPEKLLEAEEQLKTHKI